MGNTTEKEVNVLFKFINKNKKGFSLVELMVTITVIALVMPLAGQLLYQSIRIFNTSAERWEIQTAVRTTCTMFESNKDYITNADEAKIYYDEALDNTITANGAKCDENGNFVSWRGLNPTVLPDPNRTTGSEGHTKNPYTYIFSVPMYDDAGTYKGTFAYVSKPSSTKYEPILMDFGFEDVPVEISFGIANNKSNCVVAEETPAEPPAETPAKKSDSAVTHKLQEATKYLDNTVDITFTSGKANVTNFTLKTQYSLYGTEYGKKINTYHGQYDNTYYSADASNTVDNRPNHALFVGTSKAGIAGWNDTALNSKADVVKPAEDTVAQKYVHKSGNVLAFINIMQTGDSGKSEDLTANMTQFDCWSKYNFANPTKLSSHVLGGLRDFRDNVLKGTAFGDWFIEAYYERISPFLIKHTGNLKPLNRLVLIPLGYICGFVANI